MLNYQEKKDKIYRILSCCCLEDQLTLLGKVTVIKNLAASQLVYIMSSSYVILFTFQVYIMSSSQSYLKEIHQLLHNFLWEGRGDKIKTSVMINEYKDGGLKVLDNRSSIML